MQESKLGARNLDQSPMRRELMIQQ